MPERPDPRTDQELVAACNRGDADAFDALYLRYRDWVARLARRFTTNDADALDAVQETFAYVLRKFPGFRLTASMTTFLYPVVKHCTLSARRKTMRLVSDDLALAAEPDRPSPSTESSDDLTVVLAKLPATHREVLLLRFVDDLSLAEIAVALSIPLGTVKSRLHNALVMLRKEPATKAYFDP